MSRSLGAFGSVGGTYWVVSIKSYSKSSQTGKQFFLYISEKKENFVSKQKLYRRQKHKT